MNSFPCQSMNLIHPTLPEETKGQRDKESNAKALKVSVFPCSLFLVLEATHREADPAITEIRDKATARVEVRGVGVVRGRRRRPVVPVRALIAVLPIRVIPVACKWKLENGSDSIELCS